MRTRLLGAGVACIAVMALAMPAMADLSSRSFGFSSTSGLGARATFTVDSAKPGYLNVTLENLASVGETVPANLLTGVYFNIDGFSGSLNRSEVVLTSGSQVVGAKAGTQGLGYWAYQSPLDSQVQRHVGPEWAYVANNSGIGAADPGATMLLTAAGLGIAGPHDVFPNLGNWGDLTPDNGEQAPDGGQYGLVGKWYDSSQANGGLLGDEPVDMNGVVATLSGLPDNFSLDSIDHVAFNYGTSANAVTPVPAALLLGMIGLGTLGVYLRRYA